MLREPARTTSHRFAWLIESLIERADCERKLMFGCEAVYVRGRLVLALAAKSEPWNGVLVPTEREHHASLCREFPFLVPHAILPKWLYLSAANDRFEFLAQEIITAIEDGDRRFGVVSNSRSRQTSTNR